VIYVIAKSRERAEYWARTEMLLHPKDWRYVESEHDLMGVSAAPQYFVELTEAYLHPRYSSIREIVEVAKWGVWKGRYEIRADYRHRDFAPQSTSEVNQRDECQDEVYGMAAQEAEILGAVRILDVGCGGGYKLVKHFPKGRYATVGLDDLNTMIHLRRRYPDREWINVDLNRVDENVGMVGYRGLYDLVVCSDVIEHVVDPDGLVGFLRGVGARVVLSTPNRDCLPAPWAQGPPRNTAHYRERRPRSWSGGSCEGSSDGNRAIPAAARRGRGQGRAKAHS
jgi:SAM-dependent methyltransferase